MSAVISAMTGGVVGGKKKRGGDSGEHTKGWQAVASAGWDMLKPEAAPQPSSGGPNVPQYGQAPPGATAAVQTGMMPITQPYEHPAMGAAERLSQANGGKPDPEAAAYLQHAYGP